MTLVRLWHFTPGCRQSNQHLPAAILYYHDLEANKVVILVIRQSLGADASQNVEVAIVVHNGRAAAARG
jgi:hypothetical protein